jgi:Heterokaryon incompatibility protein (HET)
MRSKHQSGALASTPAKLYRCLVSGCKSSEKVWPRGDNFRSHLKRVHGHIIPSGEDFEKLVHRGEFTADPATFPRSDSIRSAPEDSQDSEPSQTFFSDRRQKESPAPLTTAEVLVKPNQDLKAGAIKRGISNNAHVPKRPRPTGVTAETERNKHDQVSAIIPQVVETFMARNEYVYKPLLDDETRMLVLLPGENDEIIQCRLLPISTAAPKVSYEALSYYWEDTRPSKEIRIQCLKAQGRKRSLKDFVRAKRFVPANLYYALLHLRHSSYPINLWVDNLCINMNDSRERAHQVSKMGQIYWQANNVCIWLGESNDSNKLALDFIPRILNLSSLDTELQDESNMSSWDALRDLMSCKWFSRRWAVQEIAFAKNSTIHCGDQVVHWVDFADAVGLFVSRMNKITQSSAQHCTDRRRAAGWSIFAERIVEYYQSLIQRSDNDGQLEPIFELETLLWTFKDFDCTDGRDRVYSLLALARDVPPLEYNNSGSISSLDYDADITDVLERCVMHCVNVSKSLDIICRPWAPIVVKPLPSWISTISGSAWGEFEDGSFARKNGDSFVGSPNRKTYNASAGRSLVESDLNQGILLVRGLKVDTIGACLPRASGGIVWREALYMAGWNEQSDKFDSIPEKLWRTLVADRSPDGSPPKSWYQRACLYALAQTDSTGVLNTPTLIKSGGPSIMVEFLERVQSVVWNRKFFTTTNGNLFGLGPDGLQSGDVVAVLYGCTVPVILRAAENKMHYKVVGECYIHGLMDGQAVTNPNLRDELFHLV